MTSRVALVSCLAALLSACSPGLGKLCFDDSDCKAPLRCSATTGKRGVCIYADGVPDLATEPDAAPDLTADMSLDRPPSEAMPDALPDSLPDQLAPDATPDATVDQLTPDGAPVDQLPPDAPPADQLQPDAAPDMAGSDS